MEDLVSFLTQVYTHHGELTANAAKQVLTDDVCQNYQRIFYSSQTALIDNIWHSVGSRLLQTFSTSLSPNLTTSPMTLPEIMPDLLPAFLGYTEYILNDKIQLGIGTIVCYKIWSKLNFVA